ncbi:MAG: chemotaxis protein CheW [Mariprofundaceae bacterium]
MDEELLSEFLIESNENLASIEEQLMQLEESPGDAELLDSIFRVIHTVKGSCGFLGLKQLEKVAHAGENLLGKIRSLKFPVDEALVSLLLEDADAIKSVMEGLESNGAEPDIDHSSLIQRLVAAERLVDSMGSVAAPVVANAVLEAEAVIEVASEETAAIAWLSEYDEVVVEQLRTLDLQSPKQVVDAGFAKLRGLDGFSPALALKLLGTAKSVLKGGHVPGGAVAVEKKAVAKAKKAPKLQESEQLPAVQPKEEPAAKLEVKEPVKQASKKPPATALTVRVDVSLLDSLMNQVGELVLTRNRLMQIVSNSGSVEMSRVARDVDQVTEQLQEQLLRTRMQPIQTIWNAVPRVVRDIGQQLHKRIRVVMEGQDTELDRTILAALKDPLTHIIRNSCDHGIESTEVRRERKKSEEGTLSLRASQESGFIVILVSDDGGGINAEAVKEKAVRMGVLTQSQMETISDKAALQLIFHAGLSTTDKVSNFSGRGVGMDVVRTSIENVGGSVDISSKIGEGTTLRIRIPLTLAIISAMIVGCGRHRFAVPQMSVQELLSAPGASEDWRDIAGQRFFHLRGKLLPVLDLNTSLDLNEEASGTNSIVVVDSGDRLFGVLVNKIYGAEEIVVKPLGRHFQHIDIYGGCSILGDGRVVPILDGNGLAKMLCMSQEAEAAQYFVGDSEEKGTSALQHTLIFRDNGHRYAIPMALVERLECFPKARIEYSGDGEVLQYRDSIISVHRWSNMIGGSASELEDEVYCLILSDDGQGEKRMCLQVDEVVDILQIPLKIKKRSDHAFFLGTAVIQNISTEVIDVFEVIKQVDPNWFARPSSGVVNTVRKRVLFVEDAPFFRNMVLPILESLQVDIDIAYDGREACTLLQKNVPDLVLTDIEMPKMNGIELAMWIRSQSNLASLPIVALTSTPPSQEDAIAAGFNDVLVKVDRTELIETIHRHLNAGVADDVMAANSQQPPLALCE